MKKTLILTCIPVIALSSCLNDFNCIDGNGMVEIESRGATIFHQIENSTAIDVVYKKADSITITVKAEANLLDHIVTDVTSGKLEVKTDPRSACFDYNTRPLVTVTSPGLDNIVLSGSGNLTADTLSGNPVLIILSGSGDVFADYMTTEELSVKLTGSGNAGLKVVFCSNHDFLLSGSGDLVIKGNSETGVMRITGSGDILSEELVILAADQTITGSGNIFTRVENTLKATITGSGNIYLKGDPVITQNLSGSGRIVKY